MIHALYGCSSFKIVFDFCCVFVIISSGFPIKAPIPLINIVHISIMHELSPATELGPLFDSKIDN